MMLDKRHGSCICQLREGQGAAPGHDLYSAQPILGKAGCGLQGVDLSHHHVAQQPQERFRASTLPGPDSPNISEPGRTWYSDPILFLSKILLQLGYNFLPPQKVAKNGHSVNVLDLLSWTNLIVSSLCNQPVKVSAVFNMGAL